MNEDVKAKAIALVDKGSIVARVLGGKSSRTEWTFSDDKIWIYEGVLGMTIKLNDGSLRGVDVLQYGFFGVGFEAFRPGAWVDYLDELHSQAVVVTADDGDLIEKREEMARLEPFLPVDDREIFGKVEEAGND